MLRAPPEVKLVHHLTATSSAGVCAGIVDRGFRVAKGLDNQLAQEAAEFKTARECLVR